MKNQKLGSIGEQIAEKFLIKRGYRSIKKNFHCRFGEIDLIMCGPEKELVFIEVKTRRGSRFGSPEESINKRKLNKLTKAALYFLDTASAIKYRTWRIDAISLKLSQVHRAYTIKHFKNILNGY